MHHLIAPSSMLDEVASTSIHSSSQKGMRTHYPNVSRSRRDTPSNGAEQKYDFESPASGLRPKDPMGVWLATCAPGE
jgi:hypothetical protein